MAGVVIAAKSLASALVGTVGTIDWSQLQPSSSGRFVGKPAYLRLLNESGCGLLISFLNTYGSTMCIAGGQPLIEIPLGETQLQYTVAYIIPNASVSSLFAIYYAPGETPDDVGLLGNSPVAVGGTVQTSSASVLKNDGSLPGTQFIESTPSDQASSSVSINNDASMLLQVLSAAVLRIIIQVVRGNSGSGKATIQIGDSGDVTITTFYGTIGVGVTIPLAQLSSGALPAGVTVPGGQITGTNVLNPATLTYPAAWGSATQQVAINDLNGTVQSGIMDQTDDIALYSHNNVIVGSNNVLSGSSDLFITANPACQVILGGAALGLSLPALAYRVNTNTPSAGGAITWSSFYLIPFMLDSGGVASTGQHIFTGTGTPSGPRNGDIWVQG